MPSSRPPTWARAHQAATFSSYFDCVKSCRGPALELGVGTGRVALQLTQKGFEVVVLEASRACVRACKLGMRATGRMNPFKLQAGRFTGSFLDPVTRTR